MQIYRIDKNQAGQRLDKFLHKYLPNASSSFLYKMLRKKNIELNSKKAEGNEILKIGDQISCFFSDETFQKFSQSSLTEKESASDISSSNNYQKAYQTLKHITIIYEDEDIMILNKPTGVLSQKAEKDDLSLNEWMIGYLLQKGTYSLKDLQIFKPSVQNRLDRNTSGLVMCGISLRGSQLLAKMIKNRSLKKYYYTIVKGIITKPGVLKGSLTKDTTHNKVSISDSDDNNIMTAYKPLKHTKDFTCLEVELITGKTHQIRAHFQSIGHPLLGDPKYGDSLWNHQYAVSHNIKRQLLHAYRVEFPRMEEPFSHLSNKKWEASLPKDIMEVIS